MADVIKGVDVASYQSTAYEITGLDFSIVKATEGVNYVNPKMAAQVDRARKAGLVVGFYHFLRKGNALGQAAYFVNRAGAQAGDILACDWESAPDGSYPSSEEKDAFMREVKRLAPGRRIILYCNLDYWLNRDRSSYAADGLWIADPDAPAGSPRVKHPWLFHQYSITGGIDRNVANFPTRAGLRAWAQGSLPAQPPGGDDMALSAAQTYDAVWKRDQVAAPADAPDLATNPTWQPVSVLRDTQAQARALRQELAQAREELREVRAQGLAQGLAQAEATARVLGQLDTLTAGLSQLDVSGVLADLQRRLSAVRVELHAEEVTT